MASINRLYIWQNCFVWLQYMSRYPSDKSNSCAWAMKKLVKLWYGWTDNTCLRWCMSLYSETFTALQHGESSDLYWRELVSVLSPFGNKKCRNTSFVHDMNGKYGKILEWQVAYIAHLYLVKNLTWYGAQRAIKLTSIVEHSGWFRMNTFYRTQSRHAI